MKSKKGTNMKKGIVAILISLFLIILIFIFNKYQSNKIVHIDYNKNVSSENLILNEEEKSNKTLSNVTTDGNKNDSNKIAEKNDNNIKNEKINEVETKNNIEENNKTQKKKTIVIDPGHQAKGDSSKEPIGPGASETKAKVTTGATGNYTKQKESELTLKVAQVLEKQLKQEGYNVIMTRTTNNINISNSERASIANNAKADAFIRIHADSYDDSNVNRNINIMPNF